MIKTRWAKMTRRRLCKKCSLGEGGGAEDDEEREEAALSAWPRPSRRRGRGTERANSPSFGFKIYTTTEYQNFLQHLWNSWWEAVVSFWRGTFRPTSEENMHIGMAICMLIIFFNCLQLERFRTQRARSSSNCPNGAPAYLGPVGKGLVFIRKV